MLPYATLFRAQGVAVGIGVVGEDAWGTDVQGGVVGSAVAVVDRHRCFVDAGDRDHDGGDAGVGLAVVGVVSEAVGAGVVGRRGVGEAAVAVQAQTAVRGLAHQHRVQGVAVDIGVVGEHAWGTDVQGGVFGGGVAVIDRHRRVVDAGDGDHDGGDAGVSLAVVGLVGEAVEVVVAARRGGGEVSVAADA